MAAASKWILTYMPILMGILLPLGTRTRVYFVLAGRKEINGGIIISQLKSLETNSIQVIYFFTNFLIRLFSVWLNILTR